MPAQRSNLWSFFKKQPTGAKAKCLMCGQMMSLEKSTFTNLRRHIRRKHPSLQDQVTPRPHMLGQRIWSHYVKEPDKKARCRHCDRSITYQYTTSSLARHLRYKHSDVFVEDDVEIVSGYHSQEEFIEKMYDESGEQHGVEELISVHESDGEYEYKGGALIELQSVQNAELPEPIKLEIIDLNPQPKQHVDQGHSSIDDGGAHQSAQIHSRDPRSLVHNEHEQDYDIMEVLEETVIEQVILPAPTTSSTGVDEPRHDQNVSKDQLPGGFSMAHIPTKTAAYATYTALEMEALDERQRTIAQKLISDILFNAKLDNLTENSMLVARVGTFEEE
uniref:BED-type domain-containing protein n=1 Tax=Anopheles stephensi TaxID=30069 RepID=A0A182Y5S4_ANOST